MDKKMQDGEKPVDWEQEDIKVKADVEIQEQSNKVFGSQFYPPIQREHQGIEEGCIVRITEAIMELEVEIGS